MARKKEEKTAEEAAVEIVPGTEEFAAREFLAREKAAYEARTGERVGYELAHPLTSTPLTEARDEGRVASEEAAAEAGGDGED